MSDLINNLNWRYAVKKFDASKDISAENLNTLKEVLRLTPSSFGLQPWKFLFIKNPELRQKLKSVSWNQSQITDASCLVVILSKKTMTEDYIQKHVSHIASERKIDEILLKDYKQMMVGFSSAMSEEQILNWNKKQCYIALGFLLSACANMHIDSCPIEGFDFREYDKILNLEKTDYSSCLVCPIGYRAVDDIHANFKKIRFSSEDLIEEIK